MTDRELFIKALDALEWNLPVIQDYGDKEQLNIQHNAINALRERLVQTEPGPVTGNILKDAYNAMVEKKTRSQKLREAGFTRRPKGWEKEKDEQEPVAWMMPDGKTVDKWALQFYGGQVGKPLYTTPPQRTWVGLTDNEADEVYMVAQKQINEHWESGGTTIMFPTMIYKAIEAKLKEKNT